MLVGDMLAALVKVMGSSSTRCILSLPDVGGFSWQNVQVRVVLPTDVVCKGRGEEVGGRGLWPSRTMLCCSRQEGVKRGYGMGAHTPRGGGCRARRKLALAMIARRVEARVGRMLSERQARTDLGGPVEMGRTSKMKARVGRARKMIRGCRWC